MWERLTTPLRFLSWTVIVIVALAYVSVDAWRTGTPLELLMQLDDDVVQNLHELPDPVPLSESTEHQPEVPVRDEICFDASDTPHCVPVEDLAARSVEEAPAPPRKAKRRHRKRPQALAPARDDFKLF